MQTAAHAPPARAVSAPGLMFYAPFAAVLAAMTFNFGLCFVNTKIGGISNGYIIACEICIISFVLLVSYPMLDYARLIVIGSALFYLLCLVAIHVALYGETIQVKPVRDLLIPIVFFLLGQRVANIRYADTLVRIAAIIVVLVGLFEFAFPTEFTNIFDVAKFYIGRGAMEIGQGQMTSNLFISGVRPEQLGGRNLLPFLGDHRVSSIFLEPVSAGNFGIILFMWALVRSLQIRKVFWGIFGAGALMIVLSDSRFGAMFCVVSVLVALLPVAVGSAVTAILPAFALAGLFFLPDTLSRSHLVGNGFVSRVILSGKFLGALDVLNWLGLKSPNFTPYDSGYAYVFTSVGILGAVGFWVMMWCLGGSTWQFKMFRNLVAAYYAVLLCVSNSPFTIKTASLLWFLTGVLSLAREKTALSETAARRTRHHPAPRVGDL